MTRPEPVVIETGTDTVRIEQCGAVGVIRFNRPERRNAVHDDMYGPMIDAVERFTADPGVGCVVLTGEGSAFSSGGDIRAGTGRRREGIPPTFDEKVAHLVGITEIAIRLHESPIVTIAAVNGPAAGAGMALALACDLRIMSTSARFVSAWVRLGFSGDFGGAWFLRRLVGPSKALEILASNRPIGSDEALRIGMVDRVASDHEFADAWWEYAMEFAEGPRTAIGYIKQNVLDAAHLPLREALVAEAQRQTLTGQTPDHKEAIRAWVEKREPRFGPNLE